MHRAVALLALVLGCSSPPRSPPPAPPPAVPSTTATATRAPTVGEAPPLEPERLEAITQAVPADASLVVHLPSIARVRALLDPALIALASDALAAALSDSAGVSSDVAQAIVAGFDGAALFSTMAGSSPDGTAPILHAGVALRFREPSPVDRLLGASRLERIGERDWAEPGSAGQPGVRARFGRAAGLLVIALQAATLEASWRAATGAAPSFAGAAGVPLGRATQAWIYADLHRLTRDEHEQYLPGSRLLFALGAGDSARGVGAELEVAQLGDFVPRVGMLFDPPSRTVLGKLPAGPLLALGLSTKRRAGVTFGAVLEELGRARKAPGLLAAATATLGKLGVSIADLDRAIGDELGLGVYFEPAARARVGQSTLPGRGKPAAAGRAGDDRLMLESMALAGTLEIADPRAARAMLGAVGQWLQGVTPGVRTSPGRLVVRPKPRTEIRAELRASAIVFAAGEPARVAKLIDRFERAGEALESSQSFRAAAADAGPASHARLFVDYGALATAGLIDGAPELGARLAGRAAIVTFSYRAAERGLELSARSGGGMEIVAVLAALAVHGVRSYLAAAKSTQAQAAIAAIARAAAASYERERSGRGEGNVRALCAAAVPVPDRVPPGQAVRASSEPGRGFGQGDETHGWPCLGFAVQEPLYYQLEYRVGGGYKGPGRGGPNPGPRGFEASAEGDLDGDGVTSLFTITGRLDSATGSYELAPMFVYQARE